MTNNQKNIKQKIHNVEGNDDLEGRRIFNGNSSNFINLGVIKYQFAIDAYNEMMQNFWIPERISCTSDISDFALLNIHEKNIYNDLLSSVTWLDSSQMNNLPNLIDLVTAPEIKLALSVQNFQEALHTKTYNNLIFTVSQPSTEEEKKNFFRNWETNPSLKQRNEYFLKIMQNFQDEPTVDNFMLSLVVTYAMEGISFISAFKIFYDFSFSLNLLQGTVDNIKLIHRDEDLHTWHDGEMYKAALDENPHLKNNVEQYSQILKDIVELEKQYITSIFQQNNFKETRLSISLENSLLSLEYLGNLKAKQINLPKIFVNAPEKDPLFYLNDVSGLNHMGLKESFFDNSVTAYKFTTQDVIDFEEDE